MFLLLFALWLIFNGRVTLELVILGIVFSAVIFMFACKFMDHNIKKELIYYKSAGFAVLYLLVLIKEVVKSTINACGYIVVKKRSPHPYICRFRTPLKTRTAQVILANSITLTPGTITVSLDDGLFTVHCLDKSLSEGLDSCRFVQILEKMEAKVL